MTLRSLVALGAMLMLSRIASAAETGDATNAPTHVEAPWRHFEVEVTPLSYVMRRLPALQLEIIPMSHHALELSGYHFRWITGDDSNNNLFEGWGGELGYRYYFGDRGPRGVFLGPSFLLGRFDGTPKVGDTVTFWNLGGALDLGYQALLLDRLGLGLGVGIQYTAVTEEIPRQELPASTIANAGVRPRIVLSFGAAF